MKCHVEYGIKDSEWIKDSPSGMYYVVLIDDTRDEPLLTDASAQTLEIAKKSAIKVAHRMRCDVYCFDCERHPAYCECLEPSEQSALNGGGQTR